MPATEMSWEVGVVESGFYWPASLLAFSLVWAEAVCTGCTFISGWEKWHSAELAAMTHNSTVPNRIIVIIIIVMHENYYRGI